MDNDERHIPDYLWEVFVQGDDDIAMYGRIRPETMRMLYQALTDNRPRSNHDAPIASLAQLWEEKRGRLEDLLSSPRPAEPAS